MIAIEETATVQANGSVVLQHPELKPGSRVKVILLWGEVAKRAPGATAQGPGRKLKQDWAGGLADLASQYSSVDLQHKAREWWGD
mgnify:CR=1 FL=1